MQWPCTDSFKRVDMRIELYVSPVFSDLALTAVNVLITCNRHNYLSWDADLLAATLRRLSA